MWWTILNVLTFDFRPVRPAPTIEYDRNPRRPCRPKHPVYTNSIRAAAAASAADLYVRVPALLRAPPVVSRPSTMDGLRCRRRPALSLRASRPSFRRYAALALAVFLCCASSVAGADGPRCPVDACVGVRCPPPDRHACPLGLVPDGCACCPHGVCGLGEAAECDAARRRPCAEDLECAPHQKTVIRSCLVRPPSPC